jgi:hypothetical protein
MLDLKENEVVIMNIAVIGVSDKAGRFILKEAVERDH